MLSLFCIQWPRVRQKPSFSIGIGADFFVFAHFFGNIYILFLKAWNWTKGLLYCTRQGSGPNVSIIWGFGIGLYYNSGYGRSLQWPSIAVTQTQNLHWLFTFDWKCPDTNIPRFNRSLLFFILKLNEPL